MDPLHGGKAHRKNIIYFLRLFRASGSPYSNSGSDITGIIFNLCLLRENSYFLRTASILSLETCHALVYTEPMSNARHDTPVMLM
jgi:hypothetical protein